MTRPLYDLTAEFRAVLDELDAAEGVLEGDLEARLDAISADFGAKVESCVIIGRALDAEAAAIKEEEERLRARRAAREKRAEQLSAYVLRSMKATGTPKVETTRFTISVVKNSPKLAFVEGQVVPDAWMKTIPEQRTADTARIKADLAAGIPLPFATLERGERLRVR